MLDPHGRPKKQGKKPMIWSRLKENKPQKLGVLPFCISVIKIAKIRRVFTHLLQKLSILHPFHSPFMHNPMLNPVATILSHHLVSWNTHPGPSNKRCQQKNTRSLTTSPPRPENTLAGPKKGSMWFTSIIKLQGVRFHHKTSQNEATETKP